VADSYIPYQDPTTVNRKLDSESLAVGLNTVERERVQVSGASALEIASVINSAPSAEYGLVTRNIPSGTQNVAVTSAIPGTGATNLGKAEDSPAASGDTGVATWGVRNDSTAQTSLTSDDLDYSGVAVDIKGNRLVVGNLPHDAVDVGNPIKLGAVAIALGANPTAVAAADRTNLYANRHGIPFVLGGHMNIVTIAAAYTGAQTDAAIVTVGGGAKIVVTRCSAFCDNANTVDVGLYIGFAATNTPTTTGVVLTHPGIAPGSGVVEGTGSGILGIGADGEDLRITSEVPTGGSLRVVVSYFTIES